jgi:hypothetical protein
MAGQDRTVADFGETKAAILMPNMTKGTRRNNCYNFFGRGWTV